MLKRNCSTLWISTLSIATFVLLAALSSPSIAYAEDPHPTPNNGNCISCHEDLYFLHDTGNWFCLKELPMSCVECHGGYPDTPIKEVAHIKLVAYPIINEDASKCGECHPDERYERVKLFDQSAGISKVSVAMPYTPVSSSKIEIPVTAQQESNVWVRFMEILPLLVVSGAALVIYVIYRISHRKKENS